MGALTPEILMDLESRMQVITENEYARMASGIWAPRVMAKRTTGSRREVLAWLLSTAQIEDTGPQGGKLEYDEMLSQTTEYETTFAGRGLRMQKSKLEDSDENGLDIAAKWSSDIGSYMAYWPQKQAVKLLRNGEAAQNRSYDGVPFFSASHPVTGLAGDASKGVFQNIFTGAPSGSYPGACPIDDLVSTETALANLARIYAYIESIQMPNGADPRFLKPEFIVAPPRMRPRVSQLMNAKFIAQAAAGGAGSGDVEKLIQSWGFAEPIIAAELAGYESDRTFFVVCRELSTSQLGGLVYIEREAFAINYYTGAVLPDFNRTNQLEWQVQGRYAAGYGHPYAIFKCKAT